MKIGEIIMLSLCCTFGLCIDISVFTLISLFAKQNAASSVIFFSCWSQRENWLLTRFIASQGLYVNIHTLDQEIESLDILRTNFQHIVVSLDVECGNYVSLLQNAFKNKYLKTLHHWLLLSLINHNDNLFDELATLSILLDSHVTVARQDFNQNQIVLNELYRFGKEPLIVTPATGMFWSPGQELQSRPSRSDFGGISINTALVVREDTWENFFDLKYRQYNTLSKCNYMLMYDISILLNFTMNLTITDTWGYPRKDSPCYDGVVGLLECEDVEISAVGLLQKIARLNKIDYAGETIDFGGRFMFLKPSLSDVSIIYTLPFKKTVWITYIVIVAILTVMLYLSQHFEHQIDPTKPSIGFGDTVLNSLALICQEGTSRTPDNYSSRILFTLMLLLSLFLTASYSAIIVSLLQTSSSAINNLKELIESSFTLTMRDIPYNTKFINDTKDSLVKRLFYEKLYSLPYHKAFPSQEEGVENMRSGLYAFYGDADAYRIMSDTYEEDEKCMLKEIMINPSNALSFPVKKGSQFREHIKQKTYWLREAGLITREYKRWFVQKPKCDSDNRGFVSVRIKDFYPVLLVLSFGIGISIAFLIMELIYHKVM